MRPPTIVACGLLSGCGLAHAQVVPPPWPPLGDNLAAGLPCSFDPAPNYSYCTDEGDALQLTDGVFNGCDWVDERTVGWVVGDRVILIDLDLGEPAPVGGVTFDTIAGGAQVTFPSAALVLVSDDGLTYRYAGDVLTESLSQEGGINHRFANTDLLGFGRYLRIAVIAGGFYVFTDEIEILRGEHSEWEAEYLDEVPIAAEDVRAWAQAMVPWTTQKNATLTLMREAEDAIDARETLVDDAALTAAARAVVDGGRTAALADTTVTEPDYRLGPPYRDADRSAFAAVAAMNARIWPGSPVVAWMVPDGEWLHPLDGPVEGGTGAEVAVDMMQNEFATASFVLTSCADEDLQLDLSVADLTGPVTIPASEILDLAQVIHVEANGFNYRDDAILPEREGPFIVPPGVARRIWMTFRTRGRDVPPGDYTSTVTVSVGGDTVAAVPVSLRVWPLRLPDETTLHSNTWGYFDEGPIVGHEADAARDLVEHYNTALTVNWRYLPTPVADAEGNLAPMDFGALSDLIDLNPEVRLWLIWPGFEFGFQYLGLPEVGSPAWEIAFEQYVTATRDFLSTKGIGTDHFAWYWVDEPGPETWYDLYIPFSERVKRIDPDMLVWANPSSGLSPADIETALPSVDILCPSMDLVMAIGSDVFQRTRLPSWTYGCSSEKNLPPHAYYRGFSWIAFSLGLQGVGMWTYSDANAMALSDYAGGISYAMVYAGEEGIVGSKRWDAWRQGIADVEYLTMLGRAADEARAAGHSADAVAIADWILTEGVAGVLADLYDVNAADDLRLQVLQCLVDLQATGDTGDTGNTGDTGETGETDPTDETDETDQDVGASGCSCGTVPGAPAVIGLAWLLAVPALRRRKGGRGRDAR